MPHQQLQGLTAAPVVDAQFKCDAQWRVDRRVDHGTEPNRRVLAAITRINQAQASVRTIGADFPAFEAYEYVVEYRRRETLPPGSCSVQLAGEVQIEF